LARMRELDGLGGSRHAWVAEYVHITIVEHWYVEVKVATRI
jgi:hypothetical protein